MTEESKPSTQSAPQLYDLTLLQREANSRFGFSAKTTLSIAQALYEKHKALTYPRTDSKALPEDYVGTVKKTMEMLADETLPGPLAALSAHARKAVAEGYVKPNKRIFDNAKVSDHFAIIPTALPPKHLSEAEQKLYDLVVRRFLAVFYPPAEYLITTRITRVADEETGKGTLTGDVDPAVAEVAGHLSPNPGGVGPMTRAMLLANVVKIAELKLHGR